MGIQKGSLKRTNKTIVGYKVEPIYKYKLIKK